MFRLKTSLSVNYECLVYFLKEIGYKYMCCTVACIDGGLFNWHVMPNYTSSKFKASNISHEKIGRGGGGNGFWLRH